MDEWKSISRDKWWLSWMGQPVYLVLQRAVLPLRLLPDDHQVQVVVAGAVAWQAAHVHHVGEQVQLTPGHGQRAELTENRPSKSKQYWTALA